MHDKPSAVLLRSQTPWCLAIACLVLLSEKWPHTVATAETGVPPTRISSGVDSTLIGGSTHRVDESSLRNRNEKELAALRNVVYQAQPGAVPHVSITPPFLQFNARPICIPVVQTIEVINTSEEHELTLYSITTDSAHYHPPIFKQTVRLDCCVCPNVPSGVGSPREDNDSRDLRAARERHIRWYAGDTNESGRVLVPGLRITWCRVRDMQAHGAGVENPYRVVPLLGAKVPVGVLYTPSLMLYNPFDVPLHVKEVYTSEGFLHLNLPEVKKQDSDGAAAGLWEIPPKQYKTVINLSFKSQSSGKYQGFVHIKTDKDNLVIPVEILAIKGGVHRSPEELDFGTLTKPSERKTLPLSLLNSGTVPLRCTDLYLLSPDSHLSVDFRKNIILAPGHETQIASVTYRGHMEGQFSGKLLIHINNTNLANSRIEVLYNARVLHGSLGYSHVNTTFAVGPHPFTPVTKDLLLTNKFPLSLVISAAFVGDPNFKTLDFEPIVIRPGYTRKVLSVQFLANSLDMLYQTPLTLTTNASALTIPLHCYHGKLSFSVPKHQLAIAVSSTNSSAKNKNLVDLGVLGVNEERSRSFNFTNFNPMKITLFYNQQLNHKLTEDSRMTVELEGVWNRQGHVISSQRSSSSSWSQSDDPILELDPGHSSLFTVKVSSTKEEVWSSQIFFDTPHENITVSVIYQSVVGSLQFAPQPIRFEPSFPGAKLTKSLMAKSSCKRPLTIISMTSSDPRMIPVLTKQVLEPNKLMQVGHLVFNPSKVPRDRDYMSVLPPQWTEDDELSHNGEHLTQEDLEVWMYRNDLWNEISTIGSQAIHATIVVDTDVVMGSRVTVHGGLGKPSVVATDDAVSLFGVTQVGSVVESMIKVQNPSDVAVYMQLVQIYANNTLANASRLVNIHSVMPKMLFSSDFELSPQAKRGGVVIPAHSKGELGPIFFRPSGLHQTNATFFVKNNLTILDPITVQGEGGSGFFHFQEINGLRLLDTLRFDLKISDFSSHLSDYQKKADDPDFQPRPVAFLRSFRATNNGNLPINIDSIQVNGQGCSAYGFEVLNCSSFTLQPSESSNILISFQPDFSASVVNRELFVQTSLGIQRVPVVATLPHHVLPLLVDVLVPGTSFSGLRQLCMLAATVALVLIAHVSISDLLSPFPNEADQKASGANGHSVTAVPTSGEGPALVTKDDKPKKDESESKSKASVVEGAAGVVITSSNSKSNGDAKTKPTDPSAEHREEVAVVKPKTKKEEEKEAKRREKAEKAEADRQREAEKAAREQAKYEARQLEADRLLAAKRVAMEEAKEKAEEAAKEAAKKREAAKLEEEKRAAEAAKAAEALRKEALAHQAVEDDFKKVEGKKRKDSGLPPLPQPKPSPRTSVETDSRVKSKTSKTALGKQTPVAAPAPAKGLQAPPANVWGMREKAALSLIQESNDKADGFSSAIGGQVISSNPRAPGARINPPGSRAQPAGFSSAIGGDPIGGDAIWQRPNPAYTFSGHTSPIDAPAVPSVTPGNLSLPANPPFSAAIGKQPAASGSFFNFPTVDPGPSSLFSSNPFFNPADDSPEREGSPGLEAIGGDLLNDEDTSNDQTFGPGCLGPSGNIPLIPEYGLPSGASGFQTFSDLKTDSAPFAPSFVPSGANQEEIAAVKPPTRTQSRFGFQFGPATGATAEEDTAGSNFSLFG